MDAFIGTILIWPLDWAPDGWMLCQGQQLNINQYQALASLLGNRYGGDGRNSFNLPDLRAKIPVGSGVNPQSGTNYSFATSGGTEAVSLNINQIPAHNHGSGASVPFTASLPALTGTGSLGVSAAANSGVTNVPSATNVPAVIPNIAVSASINRPVNAYGAADGTTKWPVDVQIPAGGSVTGTINNLQLPINGAGQAHTNMQPYLVLNYMICVSGGIYPVRP